MHASKDLQARRTRFDTDSKPIRVDNCASKCISPHIEDFIDCPVPVRRRIKALKGYIGDIRKGTIQWQIEDDDGVKHTITIPNSYYVPDASSRLLSPQHWSQTAKDNKPKPRGTWCATYDDEIELWWQQRKFKRTLKLDPDDTNVGMMYTAPGFGKFNAFCSEIDETDDDDADISDLVAFDSTMVTDDEQSEDELDEEDASPSDYVPDSQDEVSLNDDLPVPRDGPLTTDFDLDGPKEAQDTPDVVQDEEDKIPQDVRAEFLRWHHRLGHLSPKKIKLLA